ncbi:hypothetical protein FUAX_22120 [Fulvitalea axinellae]|uniref:DUF3857 domain-containing protein n=1 Tax=Fulvitalea axinellae TaxID=1182444 RepID=A0AAU9DBM5_9BACT|nr:hypothetical protein FUAX_22120 [Fulvitalea axinellae]
MNKPCFYHTGRQEIELIYTIHQRIKILDTEALDLGDFSISQYKANNDYVKVRNLKAITYNLEDGAEAKYKLDKKEIHKEKVNDYYTNLKFSMPKVKKGSVIEISYEIVTNRFYDIPTTYFQGEYPRKYTELFTIIPDVLKYMVISQGFHHIKQEKTYGNMPIFGENSQTVNTRWYAHHVPGLKAESFITTMKDYYAQVKFQLGSIVAQGVTRNILGTWEKIAEDFQQSESFGSRMRKKGFYKDQLEAIKAKHSDPVALTQGIYSFVRNHMEWDGKNRMQAHDSPREKFKIRKGNSADINLMLISILRAAGIKANPVILSTRGNGKAHPHYPILDNYNYVIAKVYLGNGFALLDATSRIVPFGVLPQRCLNYFGREILPKTAPSISISSPAKYDNKITAQVNIAKDGSLEGAIRISEKGYDAVQSRIKIFKDGEEKYFTNFEEKMVDYEVSDQSIRNKEDLSKSLIHSMKITKEGESEETIYITPKLFSSFSENPFKQEKRTYPVDLAAAVSEKMTYIFTIPEGYKVTETPQAIKLLLPENGGSYFFKAAITGNRIQVLSTLKLNKTMYTPKEYDFLKTLFEGMLNKLEEPIIIKKASI